MNTQQLANLFVELIKERDFIVDFDKYNERCQEIDDELIPKIIEQVPQGEMDQFNKIINNQAE